MEHCRIILRHWLAQVALGSNRFEHPLGNFPGIYIYNSIKKIVEVILNELVDNYFFYYYISFIPLSVSHWNELCDSVFDTVRKDTRYSVRYLYCLIFRLLGIGCMALGSSD